MFAVPMWRVCRRKLSFFRIVTLQLHTPVPELLHWQDVSWKKALSCMLKYASAAVIKPLLIVRSAQPGASFKWWCLTVSCIIRWWYLTVSLCYQMVVFDSVLCHQMVVSDSVLVLPDGGIWQCPCVTRRCLTLSLCHQTVVSDSVIVSPWRCYLTVTVCHHEDVIWQCHCVIRWWCLCYCVIIWCRTVWLCHQLGVWRYHCVNRWCLTVSLCHQMVSDGIIVSQNDVF